MLIDMPVDIYDHLAAYGFDTIEQVPQRLANISEADLAQFLTLYIRQAEERSLAFRAPAGNIDIYLDSWDERVSLDTIKQLAVYANRIYVHDPLLQIAPNWQDLDFDFVELIRCSTREEKITDYLDGLAHAIILLLTLRPMVQVGIIHFTPTYLIQSRRNPRAVYLDSLYGDEGSAEKMFGQEQPLELPPAFEAYI